MRLFPKTTESFYPIPDNKVLYLDLISGTLKFEPKGIVVGISVISHLFSNFIGGALRELTRGKYQEIKQVDNWMLEPLNQLAIQGKLKNAYCRAQGLVLNGEHIENPILYHWEVEEEFTDIILSDVGNQIFGIYPKTVGALGNVDGTPLVLPQIKPIPKLLHGAFIPAAIWSEELDFQLRQAFKSQVNNLLNQL